MPTRISYEALLDLAATEDNDHWLTNGNILLADEDQLTELFETGSVTITLAKRTFVLALGVSEVEA